MSDLIKYPITVYRVDDCGELIKKIFDETPFVQNLVLNGETLSYYEYGGPYGSYGDFPTVYSTNYEKTKGIAIERTRRILQQAENNVRYYQKQLNKLESPL